MIKELQIVSPQSQTVGVYQSAILSPFTKTYLKLLRSTSKRALVVDAYLGREVFDTYLDVVPISASIQVLTAPKLGASISAPLLSVAKVFHASRPTFELRTNALLHDRIVVIDDRCWVIGQSIKDAAQKKPTYMIEIDKAAMRSSYDTIWLASTIVTL